MPSYGLGGTTRKVRQVIHVPNENTAHGVRTGGHCQDWRRSKTDGSWSGMEGKEFLLTRAGSRDITL